MPHVLVVEDDPSIQTLYRAALRLYGVDCSIATDGERALAAMRRTRFDAVILDLLLPKVNGFEVLRELKCTQRETLSTVIVCSAVPEATLRDCDELRLVRKFLFKPVEIRQLAEEVLAVIRGGSVTQMVTPAVSLLTMRLRDAS
jgi:DNA-binding response OmpR family regulator